MTVADRLHIAILGTVGSRVATVASKPSPRSSRRAKWGPLATHYYRWAASLAGQRVAERYSWDHLASRYEPHFRELLSPN